jgi:hypothetical protein
MMYTPTNESYMVTRCRYAELDAYALACPTNVTNSIAQLVAYLLKPARNNEERARVLCRWVTANISYNAEGLAKGDRGDNSAEAVFMNRIGVCAGYADLLVALLAEAKVEAYVVSGWSKGRQSINLHAWTAVNLSDNTAPGSQSRWALIDSTNAAGATAGSEFKRKYDDFYFLTRPDLLIMSTLPKDSRWTLLPKGDSPTEATWSQWMCSQSGCHVRPVSHPDPEIHLPPGCRDVNVTLEVYDQKASSVTITAQLDGKQVDCSNQDGFMRTISLSGLSRQHTLVVQVKRVTGVTKKVTMVDSVTQRTSTITEYVDDTINYIITQQQPDNYRPVAAVSPALNAGPQPTQAQGQSITPAVWTEACPRRYSVGLCSDAR